MLQIRIANQNCQALVDSGAHMSIISDSMLDKIPKRSVKHMKPTFSALTGVGGITHSVTARVILTVNVGSHAFEQDFHVLDGHHSVILGMDFLTDQQAVIDFQTSTITLVEKLTCKLQKHAVRSSLARTMKSIFVPANSEVIFPVRLTRAYDNECLVTESVTSMDINMPEVKVSYAVVQPTGRRTVDRVVNNSSYPTTIAKGMTVAICQRIPTHYVMEIDEELENNEHEREGQMTQGQLQLSDLTPNGDDADLSPDQKAQLKQLISQNRDAFAVDIQHLGKTELQYHRIYTGNARPVAQRFYRTSPKIRVEMERQIKELLENGLIEPSTSEWRSPVVMLKKPGDAGYRFAIDYRKVNAVSEKTSFPLPSLDDVWDAIGEAKATYFAVLDMASGFWQLPLHPDTKHKSSFITQQGQYQWNRMPFGLSNATTTFQMTMSKVFGDLIF